MRNSLDKEGLFFVLKSILVLSLLFWGAGQAGDIYAWFLTPRANFIVARVLDSPQFNEPMETEEKIIRLGFTGDIMLDRGVRQLIEKAGGGDYNFSFLNIADDLRAYDILFGNLEGPISGKGEDRGKLYSFRMDPESAEALRTAGFDVLSLANNHMLDWGIPAALETVEILDALNIGHAGAGAREPEAYKAEIIKAGDTQVAYLAFAETGGSFIEGGEDFFMARADLEKVFEAVEKTRPFAHLIVVSYHFGEEYEPLPNDFQKELARGAIDAGADLVVGHHPHVVQPLEIYKGKYIAYSLGNFVFDQNFSEETMRGGLLEVTVGNHKITEVNIREVKINTNFQPELID